MKILHLSYDDSKNPYGGGGQAKATKEIFSRLVKENEVTVVTGNYPGAISEQKGGVYFRRIGIGNFGPTVSILSYWLLIPIIAWRLQKKFDIIVEFLTAPFSASFVPLAVKCPVIACPSFLNAVKMYEKYRIPFHWIENFGIKKYKYFVALTKETKKTIQKINRQAQINIVPRGIEKEILDIVPDEKNYVLFLGRLDVFHKGIDLLIEAWSLLPKEAVSVNLIIAGNGKENDEKLIQGFVKKYKLQTKIKLIGRVEGKEKLDILADCLFAVCPSRYDTFGNVCLETLASSKLLVCFDIEGYKWIPNTVSLKAKRIDASALSDVISIALKSKKLREIKGKRGRLFAKKFSWDEIAQEYYKMLEKVTGIKERANKSKRKFPKARRYLIQK